MIMAKKNSIFSPSAKIKKFTPSSRLHTKKKLNFMSGFILGPLQFQSTGQNRYLTSKTVILAVLASKKNWTHLHSKQPKLNTKSCMLFTAHLQARELCPQTYSLLLPPRIEPSYIHSRQHKIRCSLTSPISQLSTVPLPDNYMMIPVFQDGSLPFQYTHIQAHSGKLCTHK